jgi:protein-S-isoprenylcysteine O-methyltransferase Ste14
VPSFAAYVLLAWATFGLVYTVALRRSPGLVAERLRPPDDRDRATRRLAVPLILAHLAVAGLDARFGWSQPPLALRLLGFALVAVGFGFAAATVFSNPYASSAVRVQAERGQTVVTSGPYAVVRHPMYFGVVLCVLGSGLALGSYPAALVLLPVLAVFARRTLLEDRMLHAELPGYAAYASRVRYRMVPGLF